MSKNSFHIKLNELERLTIDASKKYDTSHEIIIGQLKRKKGEKWETIGTIEVHRAPDGSYKQIPERK